MKIITTDVLNNSDSSNIYNYCEYSLSEKDFNFIKQAIQAPKETFCTTTSFSGSVVLQERNEEGELENECNIFYVNMIVYRDSDVYLNITEKHSEETYEILVDEDYVEENIKDIPVTDRIKEIQQVLDLEDSVITDKEKLEEIQLICARI